MMKKRIYNYINETVSILFFLSSIDLKLFSFQQFEAIRRPRGMKGDGIGETRLRNKKKNEKI